MRSQTALGKIPILEKSVVVFSQNYLPLCKVNIKRAVVLLVIDKAEPLNIGTGDEWQVTVASPSLVMLVPQHIRLKVSSSERLWRVPPVNRREVLRGDRHSFQYCGSKKHLTLDHLIPRSRGGQHTWENVVIACERCNSRKGSRTPKEAGMPLNRQPKAPVHLPIAFADKFWTNVQANLE